MDDGVLTSDWTAGLDGWRAYAVAEMVILQTGRERERFIHLLARGCADTAAGSIICTCMKVV
jgi:hypothetical protein